MTGILFVFGLSVAAAADTPESAPTTDEAPATEAAPAASADAAAIVKQVEAKYAAVETMHASFVQTTKSELFGDEKQAGTVVIKRPTKMRWIFPDAGKQFITDGSTMWVYTEPDKQVIRFDDVAQQADAAQSLLQSLDKLDELFHVEAASPAIEGKHAFVLKPRAEGQVKKIDLVLTTDLLVEHVVITDSFDSVTEMDFSDVKLGQDAPDALFGFVVPEGVEVITSSGGM